MSIRRFLVPALLAALLATPGCLPFRGPEDIRRDLHDVTGAEYDREFGLTVGRTGMAIARLGVRLSGEEEIPIRGIRKVEIGVYQVKSRPAEPATGSRALMATDFPEWFPMVELLPIEEQETVLVLAKMTPEGGIHRILIVVDDTDELVVVRLKGKLERVIEDAIEFAFEESDHPHLSEPTLAEYKSRQDRTSGQADTSGQVDAFAPLDTAGQVDAAVQQDASSEASLCLAEQP